jgi:hypothetical protein
MDNKGVFVVAFCLSLRGRKRSPNGAELSDEEI